jgi:hypothetical protein
MDEAGADRVAEEGSEFRLRKRYIPEKDFPLRDHQQG